MIYTITMNPAIDCAMEVGDIALGRVNRAASQSIRFGGKGINVSYVLREFGAESILTGFAAGFTGDALTAGLTSDGFKCDFVHLTEGFTRINTKLTSNRTDGDPDTEINAPGPVPNEWELDLMKDKLAYLTAGDAVVIAGSLPAGVSFDYMISLGKALPCGVSLICDLSGRLLESALTLKPAFVKPNIHELFDLLGIPATEENLKDRTLIEDCIQRFISMGAENALITMGGDGAYYATQNGVIGHIPSPVMPRSANAIRSAVGCGDSTVAGWLTGMGYAGEDARSSALALANITSSNAEESAARLAVLMGSASYYFGFPASPNKIRALTSLD